MTISPTVRRVGQVAAALAVAVFCGIAVVSNFDRIASYSIRPSWFFVLGGLLFVIAVLAGGTNWHRLLDMIAGRRLPLLKSVQGHAVSWLHRYIPGVGYLGHKILWATHNGVSRGHAVTAFLYEQLLIQASSFGFGVFTLGLALAVSGTMGGTAAAIMAVTVVGIAVFIAAGPVIEKLLARIRRARGNEGESTTRILSPTHTAALFVSFVIPRIVNAGAVVLVALPLVSLDVPQMLALGGAYAVASAIGILAVFVPSGLGVREAIFVGLATAGGVPLVDAIMLSVVARLITTVADLVLGGAVLAVAPAARRQ